MFRRKKDGSKDPNPSNQNEFVRNPEEKSATNDNFRGDSSACDDTKGFESELSKNSEFTEISEGQEVSKGSKVESGLSKKSEFSEISEGQEVSKASKDPLGLGKKSMRRRRASSGGSTGPLDCDSSSSSTLASFAIKE